MKENYTRAEVEALLENAVDRTVEELQKKYIFRPHPPSAKWVLGWGLGIFFGILAIGYVLALVTAR